MSRSQLLNMLVGLAFSFLYLAFSLYYSFNYILESDTERYFYHHLEFSNDIFLFGPEVFIGVMLWVSKIFSEDFYFFLFLNFLLWLPLVFILGFRSLDAPEFLMVFLFFLSPYFFQNAMFLIRQYNSFVFFIYYILLGDRKLRWCFAALSIGSHLYAALLFILSSSYSVKLLKKSKVRFSILLLSLCIFMFSPDVIFNTAWYIADSVFGYFYFLDRKLETMALDEIERGGGYLMLFLVLLLFRCFFCLLFVVLTPARYGDDFQQSYFGVGCS